MSKNRRKHRLRQLHQTKKSLSTLPMTWVRSHSQEKITKPRNCLRSFHHPKSFSHHTERNRHHYCLCMSTNHHPNTEQHSPLFSLGLFHFISVHRHSKLSQYFVSDRFVRLNIFPSCFSTHRYLFDFCFNLLFVHIFNTIIHNLLVCLFSRKMWVKLCTNLTIPRRSQAGSAAERVGAGDSERLPNLVAGSAGAGPPGAVLHDQVPDGRPVEDAQPGPDPAGGDVLPGQEPGRRPDILLPGAGQLAQELRDERGDQVPGAGPGQAQSHHGRRGRRDSVLHRGHNPVDLRRQDLQQAQAQKTGKRCVWPFSEPVGVP